MISIDTRRSHHNNSFSIRTIFNHSNCVINHIHVQRLKYFRIIVDPYYGLFLYPVLSYTAVTLIEGSFSLDCYRVHVVRRNEICGILFSN